MKTQKKTKAAKFESFTVLVTPQIAASLRALAALGGVSPESIATAMVASLAQGADEDAACAAGCIEDAAAAIAKIPRLARPVPTVTPEMIALLDQGSADSLMPPQFLLAEEIGDSFKEYYTVEGGGGDLTYLYEGMEWWLADGLYPAEVAPRARALANKYRQDMGAPDDGPAWPYPGERDAKGKLIPVPKKKAA